MRLLPRSPEALPPQARASDRSTLYLVSCVSQKRSTRSRARDLYTSAWFKKARAYVEHTGAAWLVLSAEYGLLDPDTDVDPYERTLNTMPIAERRAWARRVLAQLANRAGQVERVVLFAGERYREFLMPALAELGIMVEVPLAGLRIGEQLSWFGSHDGDHR
jgi:hypothetical protein